MANSKRKNRGNGILIAFLCLPLAVIFCFTIYYSSLDSVNKVTLSTPSADSVSFESESEVSFFVSMLKNALPISSAMRDVSGEDPVYITLHPGDDPLEYKLYPSLNLSGCLLIDPEGDLFVLETETAKKLLLRSEFDYLYSSYFLPTLSVVSGENEYNVAPIDCSWEYYKTDGNKYSYTPEALSDGSETFVILKGLDNYLKFTPDGEVRPYEMTDISYIADNGSEYSIKDISQLDLSFDTVLDVSFSVNWSGMNGAQASGNAKYKFKIIYDIPATITLSANELTAGDVLVLNATHLNESEEFSLKTALNTASLKFGMTDKSKGVALLPIGLANKSGEYTLEIITGVGSINETIKVNDRESTAWIPIDVTTEQYEEMLSTAKMQEFRDTIAAATSSRPEENHFNFETGKLNRPVGDKVPVFTFGQTINLGTTSADGDSGERICEGVVYELDAGTSVRSAQSGKVVFSGNLAPTGNTVIVYHGYGIYSYYYHLEELIVQVGYTLNDGEILGKAGTSGFTNGKTVLHYAISIDGVFVDPMWFYN
ncbi:MAG: M23 family metallopeptidase [Ruminococcaceae bacterium]|nr:M23 family metallopeptidase [Oscillospiraceae bacterium]